MKSETHKLPKGHSYVLKSSWLQAALEAPGITTDTHLIRRPSKIFFDAYFWPPTNVPYDRLYVRAGTVPSAQAESAREFMRKIVLPDLVSWLLNLINLDSKSPMRRREQTLWATFEVNHGRVFRGGDNA